MISLEGLDKAEVLAALYNGSRPLGMGFLHYDSTPMTSKEAAEHIVQHTRTRFNGEPSIYFDYLKGRVMKIELADDELNPGLYDRDNGPGAAALIVESLRETSDVDNDATSAAHHVGKHESAAELRYQLDTSTTIEGNVMTLGYDDVADVLDEAIVKAMKDSDG